MDVDDDMGKNENVGDSLEKPEKSKGLRKSLIPHKKRVILQELEPISESNILEDYSKFTSKGSTSFTRNSRQRENLEKMSQSSEECINSSVACSSTECTESALFTPETPPAMLRLRIKEAQEMRDYLEKELTELQDFTTNEKQILATEKGFKQLEEHNSQLSVQNNKLHLEVEEMKKLNESQNNLMSDLNRSFNEMKNNLEISYAEKDLVTKELADLKQKFVDEQTEKQILETKWKQREDDLKKSLEEAWNLLHVKEDRILKMNEKISSLYSEREKAKNLDLTFGGQFLPVNSEYNLVTIDQNIAELFELSSCNFPENEKLSDLGYKDNSKGDSFENSEISKFEALQEELKLCKDSLDFNKNKLEHLYKNLANKELVISHYENNLSDLVQDLSEYLCEDLIFTKEKYNEDVKIMLTKIKSDIKSALSYGKSTSNENCTAEKILQKKISEVKCTSNSNSYPDLDDEISSVNASVPMEFQIKQNEGDKFSNLQSSNNAVNNLKVNLHTANSHSQTDIDYLTMINNEANLISLGNKVMEFEQHGTNCGNIIVSLENNVLKSEQTINSNEEKMILEKKLLDYKLIIKIHEDEINLLQTKVLNYERTIDEVENNHSSLLVKLQDYEEKIKILDDEVDKLKSNGVNEESLGNHYVNENEVATCNENISIKLHCLNVSSQTDIDSEMWKFDEEKLISFEKQVFYTEKNKQENEETKLLLQNQIIDYEVKIQNNKDELTILQSRISDYDETIQEKEIKMNELKNMVLDNESLIKNYRNEINLLENNVSNCEEKYNKSKQEINRLKNIILENEQTINANKEEMAAMQNKIMEHEEIVKNHGEEKDIYLIKISSYEETIANSREESAALQRQISDYAQTVKENEDRINELQNLMLDNESSIKNKISEKNLLENNVSNCEQEINRLKIIISENEQTINTNKEEMVAMQNKNMEYEEFVRSYGKEKDLFLNKISSYEETIANSSEELNSLKDKISGYAQTVKENEDRINELQNVVLDNESLIKTKITEINLLENNVSNCEENYKKSEQEVNRLKNIILENEQTINANEEEILGMQNKIREHEEIVKNHEEEKNIFLNKISSYEETIANSREELNSLKDNISGYAQTVKENEERINELQNLVLDNESSIKNKITEINRLKNIISENEQTINTNKEEMAAMQNKIMEHEEIVKNHGEEKDIYLNKISSYEETIVNSREESAALQRQISDYAQTVKENEDRINELQNLVLDNESSIKNKINEINLLENNVFNCEQEINRLKNIISENEQTINTNKEEMVVMQNKNMEYEEFVKSYGKEKDLFLNKISSYEETIANSRDESAALQRQILDYARSVKENEERINELQNLVLDNESSIKNNITEINRLKNIILENEQTINANKEEMVAMQNKIMEHEEIAKNHGEEKDIYLNKISSYEETIANSREESAALQRQISDYAQTVQENEDRINELQNLVLDNESSIKTKITEINLLENNVFNCEQEINRLKNIILENEQTINANKEEILAMQNKIMEHEEIVKNHGEGTNIFLNKISSYEETIANSREESAALQRQILDHAQRVKENEERINELQNLVLDNESSIKNKITEINRLKNIISENEQTINTNKEEIVAMQNKIMEHEDIVKNHGEEKDIYLNKISSYEETIANSREESAALQRQISDYAQTVQENEDRINELQNLVLNNESSIKTKITEINLLENNVFNCEQEINRLKNIILENEQTINANKEEILAMQNKIMEHEEIVKNHGEGTNIFLNKISSYEETIANSREESAALQRQILDHAQRVKENEERINELQNLVLDNESSIKNKITEINRLKNIISENEQTINTNKEEIVAMQNKIMEHEEIVKNHGEEKDIYLNKISSYEETIVNSREESAALQRQISDYAQTVKENEDRINELQNLVLDNESSIKNKINLLENNVFNYVEKYKKSEQEVNRLKNIILENELTIYTNKEEMVAIQNKNMEYEEIVRSYGKEKDLFLNTISSYEETIANSREELNSLKDKISGYDEALLATLPTNVDSSVNKVIRHEGEIKSNQNKLSATQNNISDGELTIKNKSEEVTILKYNLSESVDYNDIFDNPSTLSELDNFNKTESNYSMSSYSQNPFVVVECIDGTTLNSSTLDSVAQLEQSVLISKLPQTDYSIGEYDPLASTIETSFVSKEYDTTEYDAKTFAHVLHENTTLNQKYININSDDKIKALLSLLNNKLDVSAVFDKICEQFSIVKEMLDPREDHVIYNFCEIIENLLHKEISSKKKWNDKMELVNDTLINLHNIKDHILELKNSCFSLEKITSQDFEIIDSHLKKLFLCNRVLSAENEQLKDNLKVSLLSEERLSAANEILKNELNTVLDLEKELKKVKECNSKLKVALNEKCTKENDINFLVEEIENLLDPAFSWPGDSLYSKLKQIHFTIIKSFHHEHENTIQLSGLLPFFKDLLVQNNSLKKRIDFSLLSIHNLKENLSSLKPDISYLCTNLNSDFHILFKKLTELSDRQEQKTVSCDELKENVKNLISENTKLKVELHDLKTSNEDLKTTSKDYDILLDKYKNLQELVAEKDMLLNDSFLFHEDVSLFINSLKDLYFIEEFRKIYNISQFTTNSDSRNFLLWLQKFLEEIHNIREYMLQNLQTTSQYTLSECIEELCKEKNKYNDAFSSLCNSIKDTIHLYSEDLKIMKGNLELMSTDVVNLKHSFIHDLLSINHHVNSILSLSHKNETEKDKSDFQVSYDLLNEKFSELVVTYELMKTELQHKENVIDEYMIEKDNSKKKNLLLESQNVELNEMISKFDKEISDYKNLCHDLESEKEKLEENLKQYGTLAEYNVLKSDQIKLYKLLNILNTNMKESFEGVLLCDSDNFEKCLSVLTTTFQMLRDERNKYSALELQCANLVSKNNEQLKQIEELSDIIKETKKNMNNEIQILLTKEESNRIYFEETHKMYTKELGNILALLDYQECTKVDEVAFTFILDKIRSYKLMFDKNNECDVMELKNKIMSLEAQLYDAHDFKTKFSVELHSLKPDLDVSYLMTLSLAELQKTMIVAIIEKEKDVIADYESKLSSNTDKIQQLEEQEKRRVYWVQEMEKENDRLINECKKIQDDNQILKCDIKSKVDKINDLENQIMQQVSITQMNESIREREESINQLEVAVNEKQTLQLALASLNEKLKEKSKECEEMYSILEKKAEVIFNLEKNVSKFTSENAILEKEVQNLREPIQSKLHNFNDNQTNLEKDANYKLQIGQCNMLLGNQETGLNKKMILQEKTETNTKSVSTDFDEEFKIGQIIEGSLNNHLVKIELLNTMIVELNSQLKHQSDTFEEEFKNQTKLIESLQKDLDLAHELNAELKNNITVILKQKEDAIQQYSIIEKLQVELNEFREQINVLENEKVLLLKDKEALEQLLAIRTKNEESSVDPLRKEIGILQDKLCEEQNIKMQMQEQVESMLCELHCIKNKLASSEEARDNLLQQSTKTEKYKEEIKTLTEELEHCKMKIKTLIQEKEKCWSEYFQNLKLEKEINSTLKTKLEQTCLELLNLKNEKELFMKEYHKNVQSERDMCSILNSDLLKIKEINRNLETDMQFIKKALCEKNAQLEEIKINCHLEKACPYKKEVEDIRYENNNLSKQLEHERQTFELWKTNLEEDLHCKLQKISDLESKLNKETQSYKEAVMTNAELHQVLLESQEKLKKLEDKLAMQRDVFIRDKSKLEIDLQNKDKLLKELEGKLMSVKYQCEEFSKDICLFLQKVSDVLTENVTDLSSAITLISKQILEKQRLMEELREAQEKAEQLEEECEILNEDIKYHDNVIGNLFEKNKAQEEKLISEKKELERECLKNKELLEKINTQESIILSLQTEIEKYEKSLKNVKEDKKAVELVKLELEGKIVDLERNLNSFKNQEISYTDGIKQELNRLKLELVTKHKIISKLEMRLESDTLPFQKKAEMAEKKVEELTKELRLLKQAQSFKQMSSVLTSPIAGLDASSQLLGAKENIIEKLQQDIKKLNTEKSALKLLAQNRRIQIQKLEKQLRKSDMGSFQDAQTPI